MDTYATTDPQQAFHKRITFCMDVHNEAVKVCLPLRMAILFVFHSWVLFCCLFLFSQSMQYPPDAYKKDLETAEERAEREKTEEEIAKEIEDEMDEEGM